MFVYGKPFQPSQVFAGKALYAECHFDECPYAECSDAVSCFIYSYADSVLKPFSGLFEDIFC